MIETGNPGSSGVCKPGHAHAEVQLLMSVRNSSRVFGSSRNTPSMVLVTVLLFIFCTPRITMHMCVASITTPTPAGCKASVMATAICLVRRS